MPTSSARKVKIVCTLGPSSQSAQQIHDLILAGMDIARLNFSHGTHEFHRGLVETIREAAKKAGRHVAIMQDLQGPKIRCGKIPSPGIELKKGDTVLLHPEGQAPKQATAGMIVIPISAEIAQSVSTDAQVGARILFDDGKIATRALSITPPEMVVQVEVGGKLTSNKGMNLPGTPLSIPCLTEKDIEDLEFGVSLGVDAVALSFVRSAADIEQVRERLRKLTHDMPLVIAKIEREEAVEAMESIIEVCDGLLVARGDMAVEVGAERVPAIQKKLIHTCNELGVPVITATQMLESMISSPVPTRAEASDVANAVFDGTDCVMLSGETASGQYPGESVATMARIALQAERSRNPLSSPRPELHTTWVQSQSA
jgi:pyruvate kinase